MNTVPELVINFHMTEACNFGCEYCYATWEDHNLDNELHHSPQKIEQLLTSLAEYFFGNNPLRKHLNYQHVRINFAGGEPIMLGSRFIEAVLLAKQLGFNTSLITNAHLLSNPMLKRIAPALDMLGISFDTADELVAASIGRIDRKGKWLTLNRLTLLIEAYRHLNPMGKVKINTVVNAFNWRENLSQAISHLQPYKWKVLRVLPVYQHNLNVTNEQYQAYVERHQNLGSCLVEEDNDAMWQSYLMINPEGRFYQNIAHDAGHQQSQPILEAGIEKAFKQIAFNADVFASRYQHTPDAPSLTEAV